MSTDAAGIVPAGATVPGTHPAWGVTFHREAANVGPAVLGVGSDTHDGGLEVTLPADLTGGRGTITVEGMTDGDYAVLRAGPTTVRVHLWWKDTLSVLGGLAAVSGLGALAGPLVGTTIEPPAGSLVAELRVEKVTRRAGPRRYDVVVSAQQRAFVRLREARVYGACYASLQKALESVAAGAAVVLRTTRVAEVTAPPQGMADYAQVPPGTALAACTALADQAATALGLYGMSPVLLRDGAVHVGDWTRTAGTARTLSERSGLIAVEREKDKERVAAAGTPVPPGAPGSRQTVTMTCLGRPDLKPGDVVSVVLPPQDFPRSIPSVGGALLTTLTGLIPGIEEAAEPSRVLVTGVTHRIGRRTGFVSTVAGTVLVSSTDTGWDLPGAVRPAGARPGASGTGPDPVADATAALRRQLDGAEDRAVTRTGARVAQVRAHDPSRAARLTSDVWVATTRGDGRPGTAQRLRVADGHAESREVPYTTTVAWGTYGQVLPRYPGMRSLLVPGPGGHTDPVDVGALWEAGGGPPRSEVGDHWLVLPTRAPTTATTAAPDPQPPAAGPASHDLITGRGARVVETTSFVVRVSDEPTASDGRPSPAGEGTVVIETRQAGTAKASITLAPDGTVTISGEKLRFEAADTIDLKAAKVVVDVTTSMEVK